MTLRSSVPPVSRGSLFSGCLALAVFAGCGPSDASTRDADILPVATSGIPFCDAEIAQRAETPPQHIAVLLDRSSSATLSDTDRSRYSDLFRDRIAPSVGGPESTFRAHYIHAGAEGGLVLWEGRQAVELPVKGQFTADTDENCEAYDAAMDRFPREVALRLDSLLREPPSDATSGGTDIVGALGVAALGLADVGAGEKHVYVLSDLLTYVSGGHNFERAPPGDNGAAWAAEDAAGLLARLGSDAPFSGVIVHFEPASFSNNANTIATYGYWTAFVKALGGQVTINRTQY